MCLENSDPKNSEPLGVGKTQTLRTQTMRKLENSNPKIKQIYTACAKDYYKPSCFSKTQTSDPKIPYRILNL